MHLPPQPLCRLGFTARARACVARPHVRYAAVQHLNAGSRAWTRSTSASKQGFAPQVRARELAYVQERAIVDAAMPRYVNTRMRAHAHIGTALRHLLLCPR